MAAPPEALAAPYILATGQEVLPMGGLRGTVPEPALSHVRQLVSDGQLRFFLLSMSVQPPAAGNEQQKIVAWVQAACALVPAAAYGGAENGDGLYECTART
jgi:hypothetical protein